MPKFGLAVDQVYLYAPESSPVLDLVAKLGNGPVTVTTGYGGWEAVNRPRRRALTVWRGRDALRMTLPLLLDKFLEGAEGHPVEEEVRALELMAGLDSNDAEPPHLLVEGILPHDFSRAPQNRWVIETLEWGDAIRRMSDGQRVRQELVLTLMEHTPVDRLERLTAKAPPKYRTYEVRTDDTYNKVAATELGSKRLARKLALLNADRDPRVKIKRKVIKLPVGEELRKWKAAAAKHKK